jgi:hypothetical protein
MWVAPVESDARCLPSKQCLESPSLLHYWMRTLVFGLRVLSATAQAYEEFLNTRNASAKYLGYWAPQEICSRCVGADRRSKGSRRNKLERLTK